MIYEGTNMLELEYVRDPRTILPLALADANEIRRALAIGDGILPELPKGRTGNPTDCVLARALSNGWKAEVSSDETTFFHPFDGKTQEDVEKSVEALDTLGFDAVQWWTGGNLVAIPCGCGDPDCSNNLQGGFYIEVQHTWAMQTFVDAFDSGKFPELVLDDGS